MCDENCSRRRFLVQAAVLAAGGALQGLTGCGAPSARDLLEGEPPRQLTLSLEENPALKTIGGAASIRVGTDGPKVVLLRRSQTEVIAVSPICPHMQCTVNYTGDLEGPCFVCPCHGSSFGPEGDLQRGPATRGLARFPATIEGDRVVVETG